MSDETLDDALDDALYDTPDDSYDPIEGYGLFVPRRAEQAWAAAPVLTLTPESVTEAGDGLAGLLAAHRGPVALGGIDGWPEAAVEAARYHLSCDPLSRPALLDGEGVDLDAVLDRLVAALDRDDSPARRVRPEGMSAEESESAVEVMYGDGGLRGSRYYVDRGRAPLTADLLYDIFEEELFAHMEGPY